MFLTLFAALLAAATPHLTMAASANVSTARPGAIVKLFVDVIPDPKVHVYAPGAKDYIPIALAITPRAGVKVGKLAYPKSQDWYFEPLKEHVPVYHDAVSARADDYAGAVAQARRSGHRRGRAEVSGVRRLRLLQSGVGAGQLVSNREVSG